MAEIGLSTGQVIKGIIVRVGEKDIVYKDDPKSPEKSLPADAAIFIRSPAGEYRDHPALGDERKDRGDQEKADRGDGGDGWAGKTVIPSDPGVSTADRT